LLGKRVPAAWIGQVGAKKRGCRSGTASKIKRGFILVRHVKRKEGNGEKKARSAEQKAFLKFNEMIREGLS